MMNKYDQQAALICAKEEGEVSGMKKLLALLEGGMSLAEAKETLNLKKDRDDGLSVCCVQN